MRTAWLLLSLLLLLDHFGAVFGSWCSDGCCTQHGEAGICVDDRYQTSPAAREWTAEQSLPPADCTASQEACCRSVTESDVDAPIPHAFQFQQVAALEAEVLVLPEAGAVMRQMPPVCYRGRGPPWPRLKATVELLI